MRMDCKNVTGENDTGKSQLNLLLEISEICLSLNFNLWLRGGWAIDFLLGKITRLHTD